MVGGFNNNFRYRGVLFHVQTEASGASNPHVVTHLFHGGNILASDKLEVGEDELDDVVRELMENQHRAMLQRLRCGSHDGVILERLGAEAFSGSVTSEQSQTDAAFVASLEGIDTGAAASLATEPVSEPVRAFGDSLVSQRPLDEVILEQLVENARKRKRKNR
ncbi:MAG: hypothetical protein VX466_09075 [Myxococcota bacterium]|nr:hypothetical protein [Myxococcota bacterium]